MHSLRAVLGSRPRQVLIALVFLTATTRTRATEMDATAAHEHRGDEQLLLALKGVSTVERTTLHGHDATLTGYGVAGVAETTLLHHRLGLELDFVLTMPGDELTMAGEPLVKLPWHVTSWFEPYAATGPLVQRIQDHRSRYWLGGGQLVLGSLFWFAQATGLDLDVALGAARGDAMTVLEVVVAVGPVLRE